MTNVAEIRSPVVLDNEIFNILPADRAPAFLLVDDEPRLLESLRALLDDQGFELATATCGEEAIDALARRPFDLVLLDLRMPGMDGHQVMRWIQERGIDVTVIVLSGDTVIEAAIGAMHLGAYAYLRKPYQASELFTTVANALQKRRLESENRRIAAQLADSEQRHRFLIDSSPDIIFTLDGDGHFSYVNRRVAELLGFAPETLIGCPYATIVHADDRDRAGQMLNVRRRADRSLRTEELRLISTVAEAGFRTFEIILQGMTAAQIAEEHGERVETNDRHDRHDRQEGGEARTDAWGGTYGIARDISERKRAEQLIHYQAYHDILTDLPNRTLFQDRLERALEACRKNGTMLGVMFLDLDRFKAINDSLGHLHGDTILKQVAQRLQDCLRRQDTLARVGGDEFVVLIPTMESNHDAEVIAGKFLRCLAEPFFIGSDRLHVSVSIGIAAYPADGENAEDLMRHADLAMYAVKAAGKNDFLFYDSTMREAACNKVRIEQSLRRAIERGELEMYYQPQVDINTGNIISAEALMRWNHPEVGLLNAGQFLPIAEEVGLMGQLSDWMIRAVCRDVRHWRQQECRTVQIAVNLSPSCLDREDFYSKLREALEQNEVPPSQIEVEITENFCIGEPDHAIDQLNKLASIGVRVAIDDFGTGYSSLAYLHRFRIHTLKIDQSFVREIKEGAVHFPVVLAVISIAQGLKLDLVAEGVETARQANYLEQAGCRTMQGYLFHMPMNKDDFCALIAPTRQEETAPV